MKFQFPKFNPSRYSILLLFAGILIGSVSAHAASPPPSTAVNSWQTDAFEVNIGALLQGDYRYYSESERADNRFDIRRSRLIASGTFSERFEFEIEYELQDNVSANLLDAYIGIDFDHFDILAGQFKQPYSLQWQTPNHNLYFAERAMGYYLSPQRDIGVMVTGALFDGTARYAVGLFNGNGIDTNIQRKQHDDPEIVARLVCQPFHHSNHFMKTLSLGASAAYARIDTPNISLDVKSTGMAGTSRSLYSLGHNTKFGVIQNVDRRDRWAAEAAWTKGPFALFGEYFTFNYRDLVPAGQPARDAQISAWYAASVVCLTGEPVIIENGRMRALVPSRPFNPANNTYGAFCIAGRYEEFDGDNDWINPAAFVSVRHAEAVSIAADWILTPSFRLLLDFTHTRLSDPIRVRVLPDGSVDYIEEENVLTLRFSMAI